MKVFNTDASLWWDFTGTFKLLHLMNPVRLSYIKNLTLAHFKTTQKNQKQTLKNLNFLDIGCGGGVLCEPLKRLEANVTGIDASCQAIEVASQHAIYQNLDINYIQTSIENFKPKKKFDIITCLEVLEHIENLDFFICEMKKHLKPNGLVFFSTLNRHYLSYLGAILLAERVMKWAPIGTHHWDKFIKPSELCEKFMHYGLKVKSLKGLKFIPWKQKWEIQNLPRINYIGCAQAC